MELIAEASLQSLNTFGVTARAAWLAPIESYDQLLQSLAAAQQRQLPTLVLGGGSNILFTRDVPGVTLNIRMRGMAVVGENGKARVLRAEAGESWHEFVRWSIDQGCAGLENLSLIPGTVGAAPIQNIGAYGVELCDRLHAVETIDIASSRRCRLGPDECEFGYRSSAFKEGSLSNHIVTAIEVRLPRKPTWHLNYPGIREALGADTRSLTAKRISDAICALRRAKLPDPAEIGNAGSFFHNPLVSSERLEELQEREPTLPSFPLPDGRFKVPAAWLIERCGWKGYRRGDAGIYQQHALVLVNHGNASGAELWHLAQSVRESVESRFGLRLIPEPRIL